MKDTSRTLPQLMSLFKDNATGAISAQDMRDFVRSIWQSGSIRMPISATPSGQTIGTSYEKITQFTKRGISSPSITTSVSNSNIVFGKGGVFVAVAQLSFSGSPNIEWSGSLFRNGDDAEVCNFKHISRGAGGGISIATAFDSILVLDGHVLDYRVKANSDNRMFTLETGIFSVFRIG